MALHHESTVEQEVCEYLGDNGWLYNDGDAAHCDRKLARYNAKRELHDANDRRVFDSVLVVSDRTVIDTQLQEGA
jgi:hypothetical protein